MVKNMKHDNKSSLVPLKNALLCILLVAILIFVGAVTYRWTSSTLIPATPGSKVIIDYTNVVVILLTTVTVLFTVAALALALIAAVGVRNMRRGAEQYARSSIASEIDRAFDQGGLAYVEIQRQFEDPANPIHQWLRNEIGREITDQLSLVGHGGGAGEPDEDDPKDEGLVT